MTAMFGFLYEIHPGVMRLALVLHRAEDVSEIMVFLAREDAPVYDITGAPTRTPRFYIDSGDLPGNADPPDTVLSGSE